MKVSAPDLFLWAGGASVVAALVAGLTIIGSPTKIRMQRLDTQRVQDLLAISNAIRTYRLTHDSLPDQARRIQEDGLYGYLHLNDAETGAPYEYRVVDASSSSYELCAQFDGPGGAAQAVAGNPDFWVHPQGRHCYQLKAPPPVRR